MKIRDLTVPVHIHLAYLFFSLTPLKLLSSASLLFLYLGWIRSAKDFPQCKKLPDHGSPFTISANFLSLGPFLLTPLFHGLTLSESLPLFFSFPCQFNHQIGPVGNKTKATSHISFGWTRVSCCFQWSWLRQALSLSGINHVSMACLR